MKKMGIYIIANIANGKVYIGSTANFRRRWSVHKSSLRHSTHDNSHLQRAWDKYGEAAFEFGVLEYLNNPEELIPAEQFWMDIYREEGRELYNMGPARASRLGCTVSDETRRKIGEAHNRFAKTDKYKYLIKKSSRDTARRQARPYPAFINWDTKEIIPAGMNLTAMCRERGLCPSGMGDVKRGKISHYKDWTLLKAAR